MHKLFVVGFARETDELELNELFSHQGLVRTLTIVRDQQTGESKGYAFVQMLELSGAERAIRYLKGFRQGERTLSVRYASAEHQKLSPAGKPRLSEPQAYRHTETAPKRPRRTRK